MENCSPKLILEPGASAFLIGIEQHRADMPQRAGELRFARQFKIFAPLRVMIVHTSRAI
jgi:hypothetical protein